MREDIEAAIKLKEREEVRARLRELKRRAINDMPTPTLAEEPCQPGLFQGPRWHDFLEPTLRLAVLNMEVFLHGNLHSV